MYANKKNNKTDNTKEENLEFDEEYNNVCYIKFMK